MLGLENMMVDELLDCFCKGHGEQEEKNDR